MAATSRFRLATKVRCWLTTGSGQTDRQSDRGRSANSATSRSSSSSTPASIPITRAATRRIRQVGEDPSLYGSFFSGQFSGAGEGATIIGHQNVQNRMLALGEKVGPGSPTDTYIEGRRRKYHNGEAIEIFYQPNAITDGDSIVAIPPLRRHRHGRYFHHHPVPVHRCQERRKRAGRARCAQQHSGPDRLQAR